MRNILTLTLPYLLGGFWSLPAVTFGHHSVTGRYDRTATMEVEGLVTEVSWRNPHVYLTIQTADQGSGIDTWQVETVSPGTLLRSGVERDSIRVGDNIKAAGWVPLTDTKEFFATNVYVRGQELVLLPLTDLRWADEGVGGDYSFLDQTEGDGSRPELGIFRVWSMTFREPSTLNTTDLSIFPLTASASEILQQFDPGSDNPTRNCTPKGMPTIMDQAYPIEFVRRDNEILLRMEEYDTVRTIHMGQRDVPADEPASSLGYSVGQWDSAGTTLIVTTTRLSWPWFHQLGIPQSQESVLVERFTRSQDGSRLDYDLTVTDPVNFTEPVIAVKTWLYLPEEEVLPFEECVTRN